MDSRDEAERQPRGLFGRLHLSWPMLFLAGWLLYEFTAQPGLAALVFCAKFGLPDVRTALWLRRVDPDPRRGETCFWAYLAYDLWKVAIMAILLMILLGFLGNLFGRPLRPLAANLGISPLIAGALTAAAIGSGLSFPVMCIALFSAWRNGVRIWLGHAPDLARKRLFWPPQHGQVNAAPFVGCTILALTVWFAIVVSMILVGLAQPKNVWVILFSIVTIFVAIFLSVLVFVSLAMRLIARTPEECWIAEDGVTVYQVPGVEKDGNEA